MSLTLRPIEITDVDTSNIIRWRNDLSVKQNLYTQDDLTVEQHLWWFENRVKTGDCHQFIIEVNEDDKIIPIGTIFIKSIDTHSKKGEYGIFIGENSARGKGYAYQATIQILKYAFETLKLNRVYLTVFSDNIPAIKVYEKSGFVEEGILRQDFLRHDGFADVVYMGITAEDWNKQ